MSEMATPKEETGVSQDMVEAAQADLARQKEKTDSDVRTFNRPGSKSELKVSDLYAFPEEFDVDGVGPTSYLAELVGDITGSVDTQPFRIREDRLKGLVFDLPARRLERGRSLRTVKALMPDGRLIQAPFEPQIENAAAGDLGDAIGLKKLERKGAILFIDLDTLQPVYCMAKNCWAAAMVPALNETYPEHIGVAGSGYCSYDHLEFTEPNRARSSGGFGLNATTTGHRG